MTTAGIQAKALMGRELALPAFFAKACRVGGAAGPEETYLAICLASSTKSSNSSKRREEPPSFLVQTRCIAKNVFLHQQIHAASQPSGHHQVLRSRRGCPWPFSFVLFAGVIPGSNVFSAHSAWAPWSSVSISDVVRESWPEEAAGTARGQAVLRRWRENAVKASSSCFGHQPPVAWTTCSISRASLSVRFERSGCPWPSRNQVLRRSRAALA